MLKLVPSSSRLIDYAAFGDAERPLQDLLPMHCFGCGTLNAAGLQIKSRWIGNEFVCLWRPAPEHVGYPGRVYGGTMASVVDCHAVWAALSFRCREAGHAFESGPPPFAVVTAGLRINFLRPADIDDVLELRARIVDHGARKTVVACSVLQGATERATAEVVTVTVPGTL